MWYRGFVIRPDRENVVVYSIDSLSLTAETTIGSLYLICLRKQSGRILKAFHVLRSFSLFF